MTEEAPAEEGEVGLRRYKRGKWGGLLKRFVTGALKAMMDDVTEVGGRLQGTEESRSRQRQDECASAVNVTVTQRGLVCDSLTFRKWIRLDYFNNAM